MKDVIMPDSYYVDLARDSLAKAEANLVNAQKYLRDAGLPDEIAITQKQITLIRKQNDKLSLLPSSKRSENE